MALNLSSWPNDVDDDAGSMNTDESDVDFWGRASPSRRTEVALHEHGTQDGGSSEEEDDDDGDENMSDDEVDDGDRMEIFGHR